jgi:propane monooxygenase reductase subunit
VGGALPHQFVAAHRIPRKSRLPEENSVADTHRINFEPVDIEMEVGEEENILDAAFRQGIHLMHGCREGRCSACKSYVLDGDIQMDNYSTFACNDAEVDEGYVLLCRSHAFSDCTIELLNFDEDELLGGVPIQDIRARVTAIEPVTKDIVSLQLETVEPSAFEFKPGQYADIHIPGSDEHRSFSMATTPSTPGRVEFLIKKYPGGKFSGLLDDGITVGDELSLTGPYGTSTLKDGHGLRRRGRRDGADPGDSAAHERDREPAAGALLLRRPHRRGFVLSR